MPIDNIYSQPRNPVQPFVFDEQVAGVFDDMIRRSVPAYEEIIRRQVQLVARACQPGSLIYDLGCSTGSLGIGLCTREPALDFRMIAVDNARPMLDLFQQRLLGRPGAARITLRCEDIRATRIENASCVVLNYTLQFLPIEDRERLLARVYSGLRPGGLLLFCEKITHATPAMAALQQEFYHAYKRENGYSELEISQKREALENVLIPEPLETHLARLRGVGFDAIDIWHKWFNFAAFLAIREPARFGAPEAAA